MSRITTVFDNTTLRPELLTEWGFACIIETDHEKILFDTGNDGKILTNNMAVLGYSPKDISKLVISHMHWDHVGGIIDVLKQNPDISTYIVHSALDDDIKFLKKLSKNIFLIEKPQKIADNIFSLGDQPGSVNEQSLVLRCTDGIVVITGCAHPGLLEIVTQAAMMFPDEPVKLLMGGFHLMHSDINKIIELFAQLKKMNVTRVAPTHCTGVKQIEMIRSIYKENLITSGVGLQLEFN